MSLACVFCIFIHKSNHHMGKKYLFLKKHSQKIQNIFLKIANKSYKKT